MNYKRYIASGRKIKGGKGKRKKEGKKEETKLIKKVLMHLKLLFRQTNIMWLASLIYMSSQMTPWKQMTCKS